MNQLLLHLELVLELLLQVQLVLIHPVFDLLNLIEETLLDQLLLLPQLLKQKVVLLLNLVHLLRDFLEQGPLALLLHLLAQALDGVGLLGLLLQRSFPVLVELFNQFVIVILQVCLKTTVQLWIAL